MRVVRQVLGADEAPCAVTQVDEHPDAGAHGYRDDPAGHPVAEREPPQRGFGVVPREHAFTMPATWMPATWRPADRRAGPGGQPGWGQRRRGPEARRAGVEPAPRAGSTPGWAGPARVMRPPPAAVMRPAPAGPPGPGGR